MVEPTRQEARGGNLPAALRAASARGREAAGAAWRLIRRVVAKSFRDGVTDEAARIAYYFFLSLFPLIIALSAVTGRFGGEALFDWLMRQFSAALPGLASQTLTEFVLGLTAAPRPEVLSVSVLLAIWSASNIFAALIEGLNRAYQVEQDHGFWKRRGLSLLLLVAAGLIALLGGTVALLAGPEIARHVGFDPLRSVLRWPLVCSLVLGTMWLTFYLLPNHDQRRSKRRILAGAAVGTSLWIGATFLFRLYTANFGRYSLVYGFAGGIVVLLIWLYLTAAAFLIGGEVAAILEDAHVAGRSSQEPAPPQRA